MAWIFLAEAEESLRPWSHGCEQSPTVKEIDTLKASCSIVCDRAISMWHQSATTFDTSAIQVCPSCRIYLQQDFHARTSALQEMERVWEEADQGYFSKSFASLANFDPDSFSWKTSQLSLFGGLTAFSWSSLRWGTTVAGRLYQPQRWEPRTLENDGSYLPTPAATEYGTNQTDSPGAAVRPSLSMMARKNLWPTPRTTGLDGGSNSRNAAKARGMWPTLTASEGENGGPGRKYGNGGSTLSSLAIASTQNSGQLNPTWCEWLMGYPSGWTALGSWATQSFRFKRARRSKDLSASTNQGEKNDLEAK